MSKRLVIDQELCRKVELMMKSGAKQKEISELLGVGVSTMGRIKEAGFNAEEYRRITDGRKAKEKPGLFSISKNKFDHFNKTTAKIMEQTKEEDEQVPGQIRMFMPEGGGQAVQIMDQDKMIRFLAGKADLLSAWLAGVGEKMDKIIDYQAQILRKMDGGK